MKAMSDAMLLAAAPSVFSAEAHNSRSQRYAHVPTIDIINRLRKADYVPVSANQSAVRKGREDRSPYMRHMVRLRQKAFLDEGKKVGDVIPEIILINSHDGTSSFRLDAGLFRLACSNGLVVKSQDHGSITLNHKGDEMLEAVRAAADDISKQLPEIIRVTKEWDKIKMIAAARTRFANKALALRYGSMPIPVTAADILVPHRNEDEAFTLWRTFNVIQEALTKGGAEGHSATGRAVQVRAIKSVNNLLHFNRGLWEMAEELASK
jgi:hypothetical protein